LLLRGKIRRRSVSAADQLGTLGGRQLLSQHHLLDRHLAVKELIPASPYPAHAALASRLQQKIAPANKQSRPARHIRIVRQAYAIPDNAAVTG